MRVLTRSLALLVIVTGIAFVAIHRAEIDPLAVRNSVSNNRLSPLLFVLLQVIGSLLFVPRTVLGIAAGLAFGMVWGSIWAIVGAVAGVAAGFAFVRWMGASGVLDTSPVVGKLIKRAEGGGWRSVAIARLIPMPHSAVNTALAMTNVRWRDYLVGSFLGMLPMTLVQVEIGASGGSIILGQTDWTVGCLVIATGLGVSFLISQISRRY